jgi:hypothetical protein
LSLATSIPARTIASSEAGSREAGPMVATIFVRRIVTHGSASGGRSGVTFL